MSIYQVLNTHGGCEMNFVQLMSEFNPSLSSLLIYNQEQKFMVLVKSLSV